MVALKGELGGNEAANALNLDQKTNNCDKLSGTTPRINGCRPPFNAPSTHGLCHPIRAAALSAVRPIEGVHVDTPKVIPVATMELPNSTVS